VQELVREVRKEMTSGTTSTAGAGGGVEEQEELCFEVVATVLEIFGRMDSLVSAGRLVSCPPTTSPSSFAFRAPTP
jgi:Golgi phosphoprotein 3